MAQDTAYIILKAKDDGTFEGTLRKGKGALSAMENQSKKTQGALGSLAARYLGVAAAVGALTKLAKDSVQAFLVQEKAEKDLAAAMRVTGTYTRAAHQEMLDFAAARQQVTTYGDELTLQNMSLLQSFGMTTEQMKRATIAAQDFASGLGIDLRTASLLVGKAFAGDTATLSRYGIKIEEGLTKSEKFEAVMRKLNEQFGGRSQAELDSYSGKVEYLKNSWGDFLEELGKGAIGIVEGKYNPLAWLLGTYEDIPKAVGLTENAAKRLAAIRKDQANRLKKEVELHGQAREALAAYGKEIDNLGEKYMALGKTRFSDELARENSSLWALQDTIRRYSAVIGETYQARRNAHLALISDLVSQRVEVEKLNAAQVALSESEVARNEALLEANRSYYDALEKLQSKHLEERKRKLQELADFERSTLKVREEINALLKKYELNSLDEKEDKYAQYYGTVTSLDAMYAAALQLSGQERMTALEAYMNAVDKAAQAQEAIKSGFPPEGIGLMSDSAIFRLRTAQEEWENTRTTITEGMQAAIEKADLAARGIGAAMESATEDVNYFAGVVQSLQKRIENLKANILVTLDDQASPGIEAIQQAIDNLHDKTITITTRYVQEGSPILGSFAAGTPYVTQTGPYLLHQGEAVVPASHNRYDQRTTNHDNRRQEFNFNYRGDRSSGSSSVVEEYRNRRAIRDSLMGI